MSGPLQIAVLLKLGDFQTETVESQEQEEVQRCHQVL